VNEVNQNLRFCISKGSVNVSNVDSGIFHKFGVVIITHRNNDLFSQRFFHGYLDTRYHLRSTFDNVVDLVNLVCTDRRKSFFDGGLFGIVSQFVALEVF